MGLAMRSYQVTERMIGPDPDWSRWVSRMAHWTIYEIVEWLCSAADKVEDVKMTTGFWDTLTSLTDMDKMK